MSMTKPDNMKAGKRARGQELLSAQHIKPQLPCVKQCAAAVAGARLEASSPGAPCSAPCDGGSYSG
eukprot:scaffold3550_cov112-Isochrysis_galbana.AAC.6